jgi:7-cyano-7-deazaguanine reductase
MARTTATRTAARTSTSTDTRPANTAAAANATASAAKPARPRKATPKPAPATERQMPLNPPSAPSKELHVFPNPAPERDYMIQFQVPEFTCHCPLTGQPDFAHFVIDMVADKLCVELKSLKMYMWSFRDEGAFHEKVTNDILSQIVAVTQPRYARITARWYVRGGIYTNVIAEHRKKGWKGTLAVPAPHLPQATGL